MDKKSIIAFVLISVIVVAYMIYISISTRNTTDEQPKLRDSTTAVVKDSIKKIDTAKVKTKSDTKITEGETVNETEGIQLNQDSLRVVEQYGAAFSRLTFGAERVIVIENEFYQIKLSSKGAVVSECYLKNYKDYLGNQTQLIWNDGGELYLTFENKDKKKIDARNLYYQFQNLSQDTFRVAENDSLIISAVLQVDSAASMVKQFKFYGSSYHFFTDVVLNNMENVMGKSYRVEWSDGLKHQESPRVGEAAEAYGYASLNDNLTELSAPGDDTEKETLTGMLDFASVKIKYFTAAIIPYPFRTLDASVDLTAKGFKRNNEQIKLYDMAVKVPYKGGVQKNSFRIFIGPLDYELAKENHIESTVNLGWRFIVRPIGEFFMLPFFKMIHSFVPNYGIAILIFAIFIKIILYPLSISQLRSSQKMKLLTPEMNKLREKFKDDQQAQQKETMKLYSEYGINPMGGCLPLLLQMPILYALWAVLSKAIELRQANFMLWITDLSVPDDIFKLPFSFLGLTHLSGLAILMGITMFVQQKMTVTDPRQKFMVYIFPIFFTWMFSNFPSGLNWYYFIFNVLSIAQQYYINNLSSKRVTLEDLKKMPKKEGWFQKKMKEAQNIAESQGRTAPGNTHYDNQKSKYQRKKK